MVYSWRKIQNYIWVEHRTWQNNHQLLDLTIPPRPWSEWGRTTETEFQKIRPAEVPILATFFLPSFKIYATSVRLNKKLSCAFETQMAFPDDNGAGKLSCWTSIFKWYRTHIYWCLKGYWYSMNPLRHLPAQPFPGQNVQHARCTLCKICTLLTVWMMGERCQNPCTTIMCALHFTGVR